MASILDGDGASTASTIKKIKDPMKRLWCQTQWTNLSHQARLLNIDPHYFDSKTMLMDKLVNKKIWQLMGKLYDFLGPEKAAYAHPVMLDGGTVQWHNYADECRGVVADISEE